MIAGTFTFRSKHTKGDGSGTGTRGSIEPWRNPPPGPEGYVTLVPKTGSRANTAPATTSSTAATGVAPWLERNGAMLSLKGNTNPNYTSTLTRAADGTAPNPLSESLHHGPTALRQPFNKTSTAKNDRDSWELRNKGGGRGTDSPWDSMRHHKGPATSGPGGPGWTYAQRNPADIASSSTANTNIPSWTQRLAASGPLLGSRTPNTAMRVAPGNPDLLRTATANPYAGLTDDFNNTSTAANDRGSWNNRQDATAARTQRLYASQPLSGRSGLGGSLGGTGRQTAVFGTNYQKMASPDITRWSTASVNKESWEHRVSRTFPDHLTFQTTRG